MLRPHREGTNKDYLLNQQESDLSCISHQQNKPLLLVLLVYPLLLIITIKWNSALKFLRKSPLQLGFYSQCNLVYNGKINILLNKVKGIRQLTFLNEKIIRQFIPLKGANNLK